MLLKKLWEWLRRSRSCNSKGLALQHSMDKENLSSSSLGDFDCIPCDLLMQILGLLGPKQATKLSVLSKAWNSLVSDDRLWILFLQSRDLNHDQISYPYSWDSIFFAETNLRLGYPLLQTSIPRLSLMNIYAQRAQVPGSVIIDGGSGYCKFGWSKYEAPSGRSATFLEFGNIESPMYTRLRHFFATIYSRMRVKPSTQPVIISLPLCHYDDTEPARASRRQLRDAIFAAVFDMNVPVICAVNQATLALYAARRTSGIVVNIGFQVTSVVPVLNGKVMRKVGVEIVGVGALKLTGFLRELMQQNNINFQSLYTVRTLKENLCYVAADYEAELRKNTEASFQSGSEGWYTLSKERFQTGEILFRPQLFGVRAMSLHQAVALCIDHCHSAELTGDDAWFKTVVLSGGTACLPGLADRLEKELRESLPQPLSNGIKVIPPPYGADTAWFGAKIIGNGTIAKHPILYVSNEVLMQSRAIIDAKISTLLSTFPANWCMTKQQFRQKSRFNRMW